MKEDKNVTFFIKIVSCEAYFIEFCLRYRGGLSSFKSAFYADSDF